MQQAICEYYYETIWNMNAFIYKCEWMNVCVGNVKSVWITTTIKIPLFILFFFLESSIYWNHLSIVFDYRAPGDHRLWQPAVCRGWGAAATAAPTLSSHTQLCGFYGLQSGPDRAGATDAATERTVPDNRRWSCHRLWCVWTMTMSSCISRIWLIDWLIAKCACLLIVYFLCFDFFFLWDDFGGFWAGSVAGHLQHTPDLSLVWIDAHADINLHNTSQSGNIHGMPVSFLLQQLRGTWQHTGVDRIAPNWWVQND